MDAKNEVKSFYEQVGWNRTGRGDFVDAERAEDLREVTQEYRRRCHLRVRRYLPAAGKYLLDVASGPVQYPEYLTYSENYRYRLCADITHNALCEARRLLGERGLYVQCDITRLPFATDALDGIVSLHTIYHVPEDEQLLAFQEIYRTLKPGGKAAVIYYWESNLWMRLALLPYNWAAALWRGGRQAAGWLGRKKTAREPRLYFRTHAHGWFMENVAPRMGFEIFTWRSVNVAFLKVYAHGRAGKRMLAWLFALEEKYPHFLGRHGAYPLFQLSK